MFVIESTKAFRRDVKAYYRHGGNEKRLERVLLLLREDKILPVALRDHQLQGKMRQLRELHVEPDWLLVYRKDGEQLSILCLWLATHKQLKERQRSI